MTVEERVFSFIKAHVGEDLCDDCIAKKLNLAQRQQARNVAATLALCKEFRRGDDTCSICGEQKRVIRALE